MGRLLISGRLEKGRPVGLQIFEAWSLAVSRAYYEDNREALAALIALYDGHLGEALREAKPC